MRWTCSRCGKEHDGLPLDWAFDAPTYWEGPRADGDFLNEDVCVWTDDGGDRSYFVRGLIEIAVNDSEDTFAYGVWSSLSERSFERFMQLYDDPERTREPAYFGWLSNVLPGYPRTLNLPLDVMTPELDLRPELRLHRGDHPLILEQERGITRERVLEIAEANLHPPAG